MTIVHRYGRFTGGWLSLDSRWYIAPRSQINDPGPWKQSLIAPTGVIDRFTGAKKDLTNQVDRMEFVKKIAIKFNDLMSNKRPYMESELRKIQEWKNA